MRRGETALVGVGLSEIGKVYQWDTFDLAAEAVHRALENAGLKREDVDGLLVQAGVDGVLERGVAKPSWAA